MNIKLMVELESKGLTDKLIGLSTLIFCCCLFVMLPKLDGRLQYFKL